jgi:hypothetical protein
MAGYDIHTRMDVPIALDVQTIATDTTTNGNIIDTQGYEGIEFVLFTGTYTDGTYDVEIEQGDADDLSDATVATGEREIVGVPSQLGAANEITRVGYIGKFRYVRLNVVSASTSTGATVGGVVVRGMPKHMPTADQ